MLNESELKKLKDKLLTTRANLVDEVEHIENDAHYNDGQQVTFNHLADAGSDTFELEFSLEQLEHTEGLVYDIDEALKKIENGNYSICEQCEKAIPKARLQALPFAKYCVKCQELVEKDGVPN